MQNKKGKWNQYIFIRKKSKLCEHSEISFEVASHGMLLVSKFKYLTQSYGCNLFLRRSKCWYNRNECYAGIHRDSLRFPASYVSVFKAVSVLRQSSEAGADESRRHVALVGHQVLSAFVWRLRMLLLEERQKYSAATKPHTRFEKQRGRVLTFLRKRRCSRPRLGFSGAWDHSRSGDRDPAGPKIFSSWKHPVSITCRGRRRRRFVVSVWTDASTLPRSWTYLVLPGYRDAACVELGVEVVVFVVQNDSLHCRKLVNVLHVAAVHLSGLQE